MVLPLVGLVALEIALVATAIWLVSRCGLQHRDGTLCLRRRRGLEERCYWHGHQAVAATDGWALVVLLIAGTVVAVWERL